MPVVVPAGASPTSAAQSVGTTNIYDYLLTSQGAAVAGAVVTVILNADFATTISPQVTVVPREVIATETDSHGFWSVNLIPNANISPANTTYTVKTPFRSYDITVGGSGPYQSTSTGTLVTTPATLGPATSDVLGPLNVSGALTVSGLLTASAGLTVSGTFSLPAGGFSMAGPLTLTAAAARIVPGATSFAVRDTANALDNLLVSNAGLVTARAGLVATGGGLTVTAGGATIAGNSTVTGTLSVTSTINSQTISAAASLTGSLTVANGLTVTAGGQIISAGNLSLTAGNLVFAAASAKIVPGGTSLLVRNNADSASNLAITDAGILTTRNALEVAPSAGGALPTRTYGTVPVKLDEQSGAGPTATVTLTPPSGGLYRTLVVDLTARSDAAATAISMQFNGDTGATKYWHQTVTDTNTTLATNGPTQSGTPRVGVTALNTTPAGAHGQYRITIENADSATMRKTWHFEGGRFDADAAANTVLEWGHGQWTDVTAAITSIAFKVGGNNFVNWRAVLYGWP